jgi:iduronate 2-sulfatase
MHSLHPATTHAHTNGSTLSKIDAYAREYPGIFRTLHSSGYHTALAGKVYHARPPEPSAPFISDLRIIRGGKTYDQGPFPPRGMFTEEERKEVGGFFGIGAFNNTVVFPDEQTRQWAVDKLKQDYDKPFFISVGFYRPHSPWTAPKRYFDLFDKNTIRLPAIKDDDWDDLPPLGKSIAQGVRGSNATKYRILKEKGLIRDFVHAYLACVAFADDQIGQLLDALEKSKYADNTAVVLWSDHGFHLGEKLRWAKTSVWEESTSSVLMMRVPGLTKPGSFCDQPVSLIDIYPTICELTKVPAPKHIQGIALTDLLKNPQEKTERCVVTSVGEGNFSIRSLNYRYIVYNDGTEEFYDRNKDPDEWHNVAGNPEYNSVKAQMKQWIPSEVLPKLR